MVYAVIDTNIFVSAYHPQLKHFPKEPQVRDRWGKSTPNQVYVGNPP